MLHQDALPSGKKLPHDIFVIEVDGGAETPVVQHPSHDRFVGWSPDGSQIVFSSDRTSKTALWIVGVSEGSPDSAPARLKTEFEGRPTRLTLAGALYTVVVTTTNNVILAQLEENGSRMTGETKFASTRFVGSACTADWSPDGKWIVASKDLNRSALKLIPTGAGNERELTVPDTKKPEAAAAA